MKCGGFPRRLRRQGVSFEPVLGNAFDETVAAPGMAASLAMSLDAAYFATGIDHWHNRRPDD